MTLNILFKQFCIIEQTLNKLSQNKDDMLISMVSNMKLKFDKYRKSQDRMNLIIYVLDSRYKIAFMAYWLKMCKGLNVEI